MNMKQLMTKWADNINEKNVLGEYPRPLMRRKSYVNLNGIWKYAIRETKGFPKKMDGDILVPFSPEAVLSGVNRQLKPEEYLWYKRRLPDEVKPEKGSRWILHFGAVDQCAVVYINGKKQGKHVGGYLPFSYDITEALKEEKNLLTVKVRDYSETCYYSRGKQKLKNGGMFYTAQSGIWQTVWIEKVPECYIGHLKITPLYDQSSIMIQMEEEHGIKDIDYEVTITARKMWPVKASGKTGKPCVIMIPHMRSWSPEDPFLYDLHVRMGEDSVESYFAMRKVEVKNDKEGIPRIFLNNEPYFEKGVLDQGYWPDGLYTPPCDEAMIYDIQKMKDLGFNMIRKHIKIEPQRWYYHCDRLGMLVWQDMVNGGGKYDPLTVTAPLFTGINIKDDRYARFARQSEEGRKQFRRELDDMINHLFNCVSIVLWVPFNEGWGQFDAAETADHIRTMDPGRLIDHASGWHDQGAGDVYSRHVYFRPYRFKADDKGRAAALTECGGYSLRIEGHSEKSGEFGYKKLKNADELMAAYRKLYEQELIPSIEKGLSAIVYTQLSDVEGETNGLLTYDREVIKLSVEEIARINRRVTLEKPEQPKETGGEAAEEKAAISETKEVLQDAAEDQGESES